MPAGVAVATAADAVSQTAGTTLTVTGAASIDASANNKPITLNNPGNHLGMNTVLRGSAIDVADNAALNAVITGTGLATLNAATAMTVQGSAVGVGGTAGTTMTVGAAGLIDDVDHLKRLSHLHLWRHIEKRAAFGLRISRTQIYNTWRR